MIHSLQMVNLNIFNWTFFKNKIIFVALELFLKLSKNYYAWAMCRSIAVCYNWFHTKLLKTLPVRSSWITYNIWAKLVGEILWFRFRLWQTNWHIDEDSIPFPIQWHSLIWMGVWIKSNLHWLPCVEKKIIIKTLEKRNCKIMCKTLEKVVKMERWIGVDICFHCLVVPMYWLHSVDLWF